MHARKEKKIKEHVENVKLGNGEKNMNLSVCTSHLEERLSLRTFFLDHGNKSRSGRHTHFERKNPTIILDWLKKEVILMESNMIR